MNIIHVIESAGGSADFIIDIVAHQPHNTHHVIFGERSTGKMEHAKTIYSNLTLHFWEHAEREITIKDMRAAFNLYRLLRKIPADAIHLHSTKAGTLGRLVCFLLRKKNAIYTPNGLSFVRRDVSASKVKFYMRVEQLMNTINGKVIACSASEAAELIKANIPATYINNGTAIFDYPPRPLLAGEPMIIATIGRVTRQKDPVLFNTIAKHFENDNNYKFIWIGSGEMENDLTSSNITITGWMQRAEVIETMKSAHVYLSTAGWEGLPFAVLEAMNLSKPMVLNHCVGNVDLVDDRNGFLFRDSMEAIDKIAYIQRHPEEILEMGKYSHELAAKSFDVVKMAIEYEAAYLAASKQK
jgi:glycosyltransferase involved in cell wall biosynthesis